MRILKARGATVSFADELHQRLQRRPFGERTAAANVLIGVPPSAVLQSS
jgi:hypothetical protein